MPSFHMIPDITLTKMLRLNLLMKPKVDKRLDLRQSDCCGPVHATAVGEIARCVDANRVALGPHNVLISNTL